MLISGGCRWAAFLCVWGVSLGDVSLGCCWGDDGYQNVCGISQVWAVCVRSLQTIYRMVQVDGGIIGERYEITSRGVMRYLLLLYKSAIYWK